MFFKLNDEQIEEIVELYGGTKNLINEIQKRLNSLDIVKDEDDFFEIVAEVISQIETCRFEANRANSKPHYVINDVLKDTVIRKYLGNDKIMSEISNHFKK